MKHRLVDRGEVGARRQPVLDKPAQHTGHVSVTRTDRVGKIVDGGGRGRQIDIAKKQARSFAAKGQDEQRSTTVRPAVRKGPVQRTIRIEPGQILVRQLEDVDMAHHPPDARHIAVAVFNQSGPHVRIKRCQDAARLAGFEKGFPGIGIITADQGQRTDMEQRRIIGHVALQTGGRDLALGRAVAMKGI